MMDRKVVYETFTDDHVTDAMLQEAAELFSHHYGVWSEEAASLVGPFAKAGSRVKLSAKRLRTEYLLSGISSYTRVSVNGCLAGHVFACRWTTHDGRQVCWITQLVVHCDFRRRGLAAALLNEARRDTDDVHGIMSSHPAACLAAAKAFGSPLTPISLDFIREHAQILMKASPIRYIADAKLRGSLFDGDSTTGEISAVDTAFYVDHGEPLEVLETVRSVTAWPLGDLLDGHEFLVVVPCAAREL